MQCEDLKCKRCENACLTVFISAYLFVCFYIFHSVADILHAPMCLSLLMYFCQCVSVAFAHMSYVSEGEKTVKL